MWFQELFLNEFFNLAVIVLLLIIENSIQVKFNFIFLTWEFFLWFPIQLCNITTELIQLLSISHKMVFIFESLLFLVSSSVFCKCALVFSFLTVVSLFLYLFVEHFYHFRYIFVNLVFFADFGKKLLPNSFAFFDGKFPPVFCVLVAKSAVSRWIFFFFNIKCLLKLRKQIPLQNIRNMKFFVNCHFI